jgi:hypothetical protein
VEVRFADGWADETTVFFLGWSGGGWHPPCCELVLLFVNKAERKLRLAGYLRGRAKAAAETIRQFQPQLAMLSRYRLLQTLKFCAKSFKRTNVEPEAERPMLVRNAEILLVHLFSFFLQHLMPALIKFQLTC